MEGYKASCQGPCVTEYQEVFASVEWLLLMQVVVPCFALHTALVSAVEGCWLWRVHRYRDPESSAFQRLRPLLLASVPFIMIFVEAPSKVVVGVIMALGQYGQYY